MTVGTTWIDVWGWTLRAPVTAAMNLLLSLQCALYFTLLSTERSARGTWWARFFAAMALATLAGVAKHGFRHVLGDGVLVAVLWTSSIGSGAAVYFAQRATIVSRTPPGRHRSLRLVCAAQAVLFLAGSLALGPEMALLIGHTAVGLIPVIVAEALACARRDARGGPVASGLIVSLLTGFVYVLEVSPGRWFNHIDVAHTFMGVSFYLIFAGSNEASRIRSPATAPALDRAAESA